MSEVSTGRPLCYLWSPQEADWLLCRTILFIYLSCVEEGRGGRSNFEEMTMVLGKRERGGKGRN